MWAFERTSVQESGQGVGRRFPSAGGKSAVVFTTICLR
jgi:hypothetical protein